MRISRTTQTRSKQRIARLKAMKAGEIPVCGPKLDHAVVLTNRDYPGIMHRPTGNPASINDCLQLVEVSSSLSDEHHGWRRHPRTDSRTGRSQRRGRFVDTRMGNDCKKLMDAGPRDCPGVSSIRQAKQYRVRFRVPFCILAMRINQEVRVNGQHWGRWYPVFCPTKRPRIPNSTLGPGRSQALFAACCCARAFRVPESALLRPARAMCRLGSVSRALTVAPDRRPTRLSSSYTGNHITKYSPLSNSTSHNQNSL